MAGEIQEFTDKLTEALDLSELIHLNENQVYSFRVDDDLTIQYADLNPGIHLMAVLDEMPSVDKETFLMTLLRVNLFGKGTGSGVLGFDDRLNALTFSMAKPYALTYRHFKETLEDFINYVELFREELKKVANGEKSLLSL